MARFVDGDVTDARLGIIASLAGRGLRHGGGRLRHDQRYVVVHAPAAEPVVATECQRQPGLAGRFAEHLAVTPAVAVPRRLAVAGRLAITRWYTVAGFGVTRWRRGRLGWRALATELAAAGAVHPVW